MNLTALFKTVLSLSFMGSILAIVIILTKKIFKNKLNANWHYYVWLLLIIRLIIPYAPESSLSMFNLLPPASQRIEISQNSNGSIETNTLLSPINDKSTSNKDNIINNSNIQNGYTNKEHIVTPKKNSVGLNHYTASVIWLIGAIIMFLYFLIVYMKFLVKINKRFECKEEDILRSFDACKSKMNVYSSTSIIYHNNLKTPTLFGVIRPKLLMPHEIINSLSEEEKGYIFLHELAHLKRKDILINWIMVIVQALHWFNPIVWYAFHKIHEDCEAACDAYVLSRLNPVEHKKYGETIINLINKISKPYWNPVTTGMANNKSGIKRRIEMIKMFKKNTWKWSVIAVVLLIGISIVGLTGAKEAVSVNNKDAIQGGWIKSTTPKNGDINLQPKSNIRIEFNQNMDGSTLNAKNIIIIEEKHSRNISEMFEYNYSPNTKILSIKFKNPESDYGTGNAVNITVTGKVRNSKGKEMGKDYVFGFKVDQSPISQKSTLYTNTQYGFSFSLPNSWKGYSIVNGKWEGLSLGSQNGQTIVETGPLLSIRHPQWTAKKPRQDIPIMVFTLDQWNSLQQGKFHIGAAPIGPSELGRNNRYVFALPARYNYAFPQGYEEVESILNGHPLHTTHLEN